MAIYSATVVESGIAVNDYSLPVLSSDPVIDAETIFCFDYANTDCWPTQANPVATDVSLNLVPNSADGVIYSSGASTLFASGGMNMSSATAHLKFGDTADCDFAALGNPPILFCMEFTSKAALAAYRNYCGNGAITVHTGASGNPVLLKNGGNISFGGGTLWGHPALDVKTHLAFAVVPDQALGTTTWYSFVNGVLLLSATVSGSVYGTPTRPWSCGNETSFSTTLGIYHRAWLKRLDLIDGASTKAAILAAVAADYALMAP